MRISSNVARLGVTETNSRWVIVSGPDASARIDNNVLTMKGEKTPFLSASFVRTFCYDIKIVSKFLEFA